jgi:hypothetical protein
LHGIGDLRCRRHGDLAHHISSGRIEHIPQRAAAAFELTANPVLNDFGGGDGPWAQIGRGHAAPELDYEAASVGAGHCSRND